MYSVLKRIIISRFNKRLIKLYFIPIQYTPTVIIIIALDIVIQLKTNTEKYLHRKRLDLIQEKCIKKCSVIRIACDFIEAIVKIKVIGMIPKTDNVASDILNPSEPINTKLLLSDEEVFKNDVSGSVMDADIMETNSEGYTVYRERWLMLAFFVLYSASNSLQWTQYTIIADVIVKYYGVSTNAVSWTSLVYMVTYVPLIFPASWLLDKTVSAFLLFSFHQ